MFPLIRPLPVPVLPYRTTLFPDLFADAPGYGHCGHCSDYCRTQNFKHLAACPTHQLCNIK